MTTDTPCPTWCGSFHEAGGDHCRDVFSGEGPGGTTHVDLIQTAEGPIEVQVVLEQDAPEYLDMDDPPEPSTESYTAAAARQFAAFAALDPDLGEFSTALAEAADLVDAHQDPNTVVPNVPVLVPTRVWLTMVAASQAPAPWT